MMNFATDGTPVLFEAYFRYGSVVRSGNEVWRAFAHISLGALMILAPRQSANRHALASSP